MDKILGGVNTSLGRNSVNSWRHREHRSTRSRGVRCDSMAFFIQETSDGLFAPIICTGQLLAPSSLDIKSRDSRKSQQNGNK